MEEYVGYVYKLYDEKGNFYIGSTSNMYMRFSKHITDSKTKNTKLYKYMREHGADKFKISILEEVKYVDVDELRMKETEYFDMLQPQLNDNRPYSTAEWKKDWLVEYIREYQKNNKIKLSEYRKLLRGRDVDKANEKQRIYRKLNRDKVLKNKREYRLKNKDRMNELERIRKARNKEEINKKKREYRLKNKDRVNELQRIRKAKNREEIKLKNQSNL
jgi:hypothetical protein